MKTIPFSVVLQIIVVGMVVTMLVHVLREWRSHKKKMAKIDAETKAAIRNSRIQHNQYMASINGPEMQPFNQSVKQVMKSIKKAKAKKPPHFKMKRKPKNDWLE